MKTVLISMFILFLLLVAAGISLFFIDNQQLQTEQTLRSYAVENADRKAQHLALQLDSRLITVQKSLEPLAQQLSNYDVWNYDVASKLRPVIADRNNKLAGISFVFNAAHRKDYPTYFWLGDSLLYINPVSDYNLEYWRDNWYMQAMNRDHSVIVNFSDLTAEATVGRRISNKEGFVKGILLGSPIFYDILQNDADTTTSAFLINKEYNINKDANNQLYALGLSIDVNENLEEAILQQHSNATDFIAGDDNFHIAYAPLTAVDWTVAVVVESSRDSGFHIGIFLQEHKNTLIASAVALVFLLFVLLFLLSRRTTGSFDDRRIHNKMNIGR
jgi:hypothetical protein